MFDYLASPTFAGVMFMIIALLLCGIIGQLKGIREELSAFLRIYATELKRKHHD